MRKILLSIILFTTAISTLKAQTDYCKDIEKSVSGENVFYESPTPGDKKEEVGQFGFIKNIDKKGAFTFFKLGLSISEAYNTITDASITFEDDDVLNFSNLNVKKGKEVQLIEVKYLYSTLLPLTNDQMAKFKTKKIKYYTFLGKKRYPGLGNPKVKIMAYANCIDALNDGPPPAAVVPDKKSIDGFWGINFGSSLVDVKAAIIAKGGKFNADISKPDKFFFDDAIFTQRNTDFICTSFINGKFYEADVIFPKLEDVQLFSTFKTVTSELTEVYGVPNLIKKFEPPYSEGDGYEVQAIKLGKAQYGAIWTTSNGNEITALINKNGSISLFYTDTTLEKAKDAKKTSDY